MTTDFGDFPLTGRELIADGVALGYGPRRMALDQVLVEAAVEAGAELREGFGVEAFTTERVRSGQRNELSMPAYQENLRLAQLQPPPDDVYRLRAALRGNPEATNLFYKAREGMIPREAFSNPENLRGLMAGMAPRKEAAAPAPGGDRGTID